MNRKIRTCNEILSRKIMIYLRTNISMKIRNNINFTQPFWVIFYSIIQPNKLINRTVDLIKQSKVQLFYPNPHPTHSPIPFNNIPPTKHIIHQMKYTLVITNVMYFFLHILQYKYIYTNFNQNPTNIEDKQNWT